MKFNQLKPGDLFQVAHLPDHTFVKLSPTLIGGGKWAVG